MESIVTADISKFGYRELGIAAKLLELYSERGSDFLGCGLSISFNMNSGYVYLSDDNFTVGILDEKEEHIVQLFFCSECGYENIQVGAITEGKDFIANDGYCSKECLKVNT